MSTGRLICIAVAVFCAFVEILLIVHHAVKIRLGDAAEGWSISFTVSLLITPVIIAALIEIAIHAPTPHPPPK